VKNAGLALRYRTVKLAIFDLDHTLLSGDSDVLWCEFLLARGLLDRAAFGERSAQVEQGYRGGSITVQAFSEFYLSTLAGRSRAQLAALRDAFMSECILPRIPASARALVHAHRAAGELLVMSTATNRYLTELTAIELGFEHLIATEPEEADGVFTGRSQHVLNMREGKLLRLREWLAAMKLPTEVLTQATFYSDSINDLPLLQAIGRAIAVDPDAKLLAYAQAQGWTVLRLER
jgi:HAD superfamily hydrolase (TIGR01490 family)